LDPVLPFFGTLDQKRESRIGEAYLYAIKMHMLIICIYNTYTYALYLHVLRICNDSREPSSDRVKPMHKGAT